MFRGKVHACTPRMRKCECIVIEGAITVKLADGVYRGLPLSTVGSDKSPDYFLMVIINPGSRESKLIQTLLVLPLTWSLPLHTAALQCSSGISRIACGPNELKNFPANSLLELIRGGKLCYAKSSSTSNLLNHTNLLLAYPFEVFIINKHSYYGVFWV